MKMKGKWPGLFDKSVLFLILCLWTITSSAQTAQQPDGKAIHQLSAKEAVEYARKNNYQVRKALEDIQIQHQVNREVTSNALPQVNGSAGINHFPQVAVQSFPNFIAMGTYGVLVDQGVKDGSGNTIVAPSDYGLINAQFGTKWTSTIGVSLNQLLFDGQVFVGLQARDAAMSFARKSAEVTEQDVIVNVYKVYFQLLIAKYQLELSHENIARFEKLFHDTREIYKNGFAEKLDVDKVSVTLTNLRTDSLRLKTQMDNGYYGLKLLMGMPIRDSIVLTEDLTEERIKSEILDTAYNYQDRREYQLLEIGKSLNEYNVKRYKMSYLPTLSAVGQLNTAAQRNQFDFFSAGGQWFANSLIGVSINVPIFDGFRKDALIRQAKSAVKKTEFDMEMMKLNIDNEVASSLNTFKAAVYAVDAQRSNMKVAEAVFDQTKLKYDQGLGSNTEITQTQAELRLAQTNYFAALYDATVAKIDYLKAIGKVQ
ncbi:TolC family protein [Flavihumibacter petaseus]|uniref:Putative RND-type efflux pump outer membrane protein n=1 Tax=Flavihumibacter petaseus NBRC 106054 TaxID=1220578 RepID=A0A0E9MXK2_9BACT|nr:TolC family protein [Flavihumibacter petaseus]GAO41855.1 putative RND-type efflux pump outer membrane protein [Flavihumibacter petaseus NBRC 106054]